MTAADRDAEAVIRAAIAETHPDHGIRGEEHGWEKRPSKYTWVIDPIDGTRSFITGQMHWATLIALNDGQRVVAGVIHQPYVGETFLAVAGGPAEWRRGGETRRARDPSLRPARRRHRRLHDARHVRHPGDARGVRAREGDACGWSVTAATATPTRCWPRA